MDNTEKIRDIIAETKFPTDSIRWEYNIRIKGQLLHNEEDDGLFRRAEEAARKAYADTLTATLAKPEKKTFAVLHINCEDISKWESSAEHTMEFLKGLVPQEDYTFFFETFGTKAELDAFCLALECQGCGRDTATYTDLADIATIAEAMLAADTAQESDWSPVTDAIRDMTEKPTANNVQTTEKP